MTFGQAFVGTWRAILRSRTLLSTMLLSVALYGFYYPAPYAHETAQRLPVIIVDQDNSALSRAMVRDLDATRAVEIVATASDVAEARRRGYDGVVCGHIHHAEIRDVDGTLYCNDGDWVESRSALVEHHDGRLELVFWQAGHGAEVMSQRAAETV